MMQVREASADDIRKVIMRLRAADKAEQLATRFDDTVAGVIEAAVDHVSNL
jgi:N-acetylglutamate synthase-like GNAT family acetyltransferase